MSHGHDRTYRRNDLARGVEHAHAAGRAADEGWSDRPREPGQPRRLQPLYRLLPPPLRPAHRGAASVDDEGAARTLVHSYRRGIRAHPNGAQDGPAALVEHSHGPVAQGDEVAVDGAFVRHEDAPAARVDRDGRGEHAHGQATHEPPARGIQDAHAAIRHAQAAVDLDVAAVGNKDAPGLLVHGQVEGIPSQICRVYERSAVGVKHADAVAVLIEHERAPGALVHRDGAGRLAHGDAAHEPPAHDVKDTHLPKAATVLAGDKDPAGPLVDGHALRQQPHGDGAYDGPAVSVQHAEAARPGVTAVADHERPPDPFVHRNGQGRQADMNRALDGPTARVKHCDA